MLRNVHSYEGKILISPRTRFLVTKFRIPLWNQERGCKFADRVRTAGFTSQNPTWKTVSNQRRWMICVTYSAFSSCGIDSRTQKYVCCLFSLEIKFNSLVICTIQWSCPHHLHENEPPTRRFLHERFLHDRRLYWDHIYFDIIHIHGPPSFCCAFCLRTLNLFRL